MRCDLALLQERNQSDSLLTDSVLAQRLADYFARHGTQAERLEAHYLLARTWADLGQAPRALEAYHTAAEQADTTRLDSLSCHFLSRIYGQMGGLLYSYQLPRNALNAYKAGASYARRSRELWVAANLHSQQSRCYYHLDMKDSALIVSNEAVSQFNSLGDTLSANLCLGVVAYHYLQIEDYEKAGKYLDLYQNHSLLTDDLIRSDENRKLIYVYNGLYYLGTECTDSALYYFYKVIRESNLPNNIGLAYQGLYRTYDKLRVADSVRKYAALYADMSEQTSKQATSSALLSMHHLYDYSHFQALANRKTIEAGQANRRALILAIVLLLFVAIVYNWHVRYRARMALMCQQMNARYANALILYNKVKAELQTLTEQSTEQRQQAEAELEQLREELTKAQRDKCSPDQWTEVGELLNSRLFLEFHQAAAQAKTMPVEKWQQLRKLVNAKMPHFIDSLSNYNYAPDLQETQLILLLKLRFLPSEVGVLLRMTSYAISKKRKKLLKKMFNIDGSPDEFDRQIMLLGADETVDF
jgi:hypothetical protein